MAAEALRRVGALCTIEPQAGGLDTEARRQLRQERAKPALAELHAWLLSTQRAVVTGSGTGKAIEHALKRWPALMRYADSGALPIDNNAVEKAIRPIAIGKKNWLFAGSERAGRTRLIRDDKGECSNALVPCQQPYLPIMCYVPLPVK